MSDSCCMCAEPAVAVLPTGDGACAECAEAFRRWQGELQQIQELDCPECGRHLIVICGPPTSICAACQTVPGWHRDPKLRELFNYGPRKP